MADLDQSVEYSDPEEGDEVDPRRNRKGHTAQPKGDDAAYEGQRYTCEDDGGGAPGLQCGMRQ